MPREELTVREVMERLRRLPQEGPVRLRVDGEERSVKAVSNPYDSVVYIYYNEKWE